MMKIFVFLFFIVILTGCSSSKEITKIPDVTKVTNTIPTPSEIQADTCFTTKQLRDYYKFVERMTKLENKRESDSLKFELKRQKQQDKNEIDSLRVELKKHRSDNTVIKYEIRFDSKKFSDSLSTIRRLYRDSIGYETAALKNDLRIEKELTTRLKAELNLEKAKDRQENRTQRAKLNRWWLFIFGFCTCLILMITLRLFWKTIKTYLSKFIPFLK